MSKWIWAIVVIVGLALGVIMVVIGMKENKAAEPIAEPAIVPYEHVISGAGIIEASSDNIRIATHLSGVVETVYVDEGDKVKKGEPLFHLDDRDLQAEFAFREADLKVAEANVKVAEAELAEKRDLYKLVQAVTDKRAVSIEEIERRSEAVHIAEARVNIAEADVIRVQASIAQIKTDIDRATVRSPIDGEVLQVNVQPGEYAAAGVNDEPLILVGETDTLHVRVDVDETDAWRFTPNGEAFAVLRGNQQIQIPLTFVYIEPFISPKRSLTGDTSERVDTRVLQVIYSFDPKGYPVYVGQQVDVYIEESPELHTNENRPTSS